MHGHLKKDIEEFGPHAFWLFSYERMNGILGSYSKCIESQLMDRFLQDNTLLSVNLPKEFESNFKTCALFKEDEVSSPVIVLPSRSKRSVLLSFELDSVQKVLFKLRRSPFHQLKLIHAFESIQTLQCLRWSTVQ